MITYITISAKHPHNSTITVKHITTTVYTYTNSQKTNSPQIICLYVFVCPPLFFKPSYHVLWMLKTKTKQKTSKFYISTWHDMMWYDMMWHDTAWHDRAPAGWSCAAAPCWGRCYSAERKPAIGRARTPSPAEVAAAVPQPPGRPRSGASGAAWWWPAPQGGKMQRTQRHWLLGNKQVSNLVFYAQSTITVISGWLLLGRGAGESNSSSQWATFKGGGKTSQKNTHKKSLKEGRKHHKKTQKRGEDLTEKVSLGKVGVGN